MLFFLCSLSLSLECQLLRHPGSTLHTTAGCSCVLHSHSGTCSVLGRSHGNPLATSQNQEGVFYGSYFPEAETDAQKGRLTCSRSSCKEVTELRFASSSLCRPRLPAKLLPGSSWTLSRVPVFFAGCDVCPFTAVNHSGEDDSFSVSPFSKSSEWSCLCAR